MLARPGWIAAPATIAITSRAPANSGLLPLLRLWMKRAAQRRALAQLDAMALRDIGVTPSEARHEANKPFWRA